MSPMRLIRRLNLTVVIGLVVVAAVAFGGAGLVLSEAHQTANRERSYLCDQEAKTRGVLRDLLEDARAQTRQQVPPGPARRRAIRFYDKHLRKLSELSCE